MLDFHIKISRIFDMYTVIDVARQTGISPRTLRFWASKDLFPLAQKDKNGVRYFSKQDIEWARWVKCLRSLDMSIKNIRLYCNLLPLGVKSATQRKNLLKEQQVKIENHIKKLQKSIKTVKNKIAIYEDMEALGEDLFDPNSKFYYKKMKKYRCKKG